MGGDRRLHEPSQQWCTRSWGFHTVRGGIVREDNRFHPRIICSRRCKEGVLFRWDRILPGCRLLHESQPISNQLVGWGFHTVRGGIDPEDHRSRPRFVGVLDVWKDFRLGDGTISRPGGAGRWLHEPQVEVSTPRGEVSTRGTTMFVSGMLEL